jgi:hypothetical protein
MSPKEIHENFMDTFWKEFPSYSTVKKWATEQGDEEPPGRPQEVTNDETAEAVHYLVMCDRGETCEAMDISFVSIRQF